MERTACAGSRWMTCEIDIICSMSKKDISFAWLMPRSRINYFPRILPDQKNLESSDLPDLSIFFDKTCQNLGHPQKYASLGLLKR